MKKLLPHLFSIKIELVFVTVKLYDEGSILSDVSIEFLILATASVRLLAEASIRDPLKLTV